MAVPSWLTDPLADLTLCRSTIDRSAHRRGDPDLLATLLSDPATRVARLDGDRMAVQTTPHPRLQWRAPIPEDATLPAFFLGEVGEAAYVVVVGAGDDVPEATSMTLREAGLLLDDLDAGAFTTGQALANWHATHTHCPRCGGPTEPVQGGWVRRCSTDGSDHFPRTDPAVIVAVIDDDERLLLGRGAAWPPGRFSVLAGFVEPGESLEAAAIREIGEESGVLLQDVRYVGSQPWPFPCSVMIGMTARARATDLQPDLTEMAEVRWVSREEYRDALADGSILTPGGISIARRLIEAWFGERLEGAGWSRQA